MTTRRAASADLLLSFGPATWPHMLARAMLAEQLFRATAILANHPYHREGLMRRARPPAARRPRCSPRPARRSQPPRETDRRRRWPAPAPRPQAAEARVAMLEAAARQAERRGGAAARRAPARRRRRSPPPKRGSARPTPRWPPARAAVAPRRAAARPPARAARRAARRAGDDGPPPAVLALADARLGRRTGPGPRAARRDHAGDRTAQRRAPGRAGRGPQACRARRRGAPRGRPQPRRACRAPAALRRAGSQGRRARRRARAASAFGAGDRVLASGESVLDLGGEARGAPRGAPGRRASSPRSPLAPPRPGRAATRRSAPPTSPISLPARAPVIEGLGDGQRAPGSRSRGLRFATPRGSRVIAPADGTIAVRRRRFATMTGSSSSTMAGLDQPAARRRARPAARRPRSRRGEPLGRALGRFGVELRDNGQPRFARPHRRFICIRCQMAPTAAKSVTRRTNRNSTDDNASPSLLPPARAGRRAGDGPGGDQPPRRRRRRHARRSSRRS